jgi:hypothetical protein
LGRGAAQPLHAIARLHHVVAGDAEHLHDSFPDDGLVLDDYDAHDNLPAVSIAEGTQGIVTSWQGFVRNKP